MNHGVKWVIKYGDFIKFLRFDQFCRFFGQKIMINNIVIWVLKRSFSTRQIQWCMRKIIWRSIGSPKWGFSTKMSYNAPNWAFFDKLNVTNEFFINFTSLIKNRHLNPHSKKILKKSIWVLKRIVLTSSIRFLTLNIYWMSFRTQIWNVISKWY